MKKYLTYFPIGFALALCAVAAVPNEASAVKCVLNDLSSGSSDKYVCTLEVGETVAALPDGCSGGGVGSGGRYLCPTLPGGFSAKPPSGELTIDKPFAEKGALVTLNWSVTGDTTTDPKPCTISRKTRVGLNGPYSFVPNSEGDYVLRCTDINGNDVEVDRVTFRFKKPTDPEVGGGDNETTGEAVNTNITYYPLEPLSGVDQSGKAGIAQLISDLFKIIVNLAAFLAVVVLVIGGITYMVSESTVTKLVGRERVKAAFIGLLIIGASWLILRTINPDLLTFDESSLKPAPAWVFKENDGGGGGGGGGGKVDLGKDGVKRFDVTNKILNDLEKKVDCISGTKCVWDKVLVFNNDKAKSKQVIDAIEEFKNDCKGKGVNIGGWKPVEKQGKVAGGAGSTTAYICVNRDAQKPNN